MKRSIVVLWLGLCLLGINSCEHANKIVPGVGLYQAGRSLTTGYHSLKMVKSMSNSGPLFQGYDYVRVETMIAPRDEEAQIKIADAFSDNMKYLLNEDLEATGVKTVLCSSSPCEGRVIVVQFKEKGYDESLVQKIFIGDKIRGSLYFIDQETGTVIREENFESISTYKDMFHLMHSSFSLKMLKEITDSDEMKAASDRVNEIDPIKPEYADLLKAG